MAVSVPMPPGSRRSLRALAAAAAGIRIRAMPSLFPSAKLKLEADTRMSAEEKAQKLSLIEEKLSELKVLEKNLM